MSLGDILALKNRASLADIMHKTPIASVTVTNTKWTDGAITVNATDNTITIVGHGLINGDRVVFVPTTEDYTAVPTGIKVGYPLYVRDVVGDVFKVEETSGGGAIDITAVGNPNKYRIEKLATSSITVSGLSGNRYVAVIKGAGSAISKTVMGIRFNGITAAVYNALPSATGLQSYSPLFVASNLYSLNSYAIADLICVNSRVLGGIVGMCLGADSTTTTTQRSAECSSGLATVYSSYFSTITGITLLYGSGFLLDGATLEVYSA